MFNNNERAEILNTPKLCEWCHDKPVKLPKNITCSVECGAARRWHLLRQSGKDVSIRNARESARRTVYYKRVQQEIDDQCRDRGIAVTPEIRTLYIYARNRGYHNGYFAAAKRARAGTLGHEPRTFGPK